MSLTSEQAKTVADTMLADFDNEVAATKRVIGAIPAGQENYAPNPSNMTAIDLAWHIASADPFFLNAVAEGQFAHGDGNAPVYWDTTRLARNDLAFTRPTAPLLAGLRADYGVRWLVVDRDVAPESPELGELADLRFDNGRMGVYELR